MERCLSHFTGSVQVRTMTNKQECARRVVSPEQNVKGSIAVVANAINFNGSLSQTLRKKAV